MSEFDPKNLEQAHDGASNETSAPVTFQPDDLHDLFAGAASPDAEDPLAALRDDPNYAALIKELEYIAAQARLLFDPVTADEDPSDAVWTNIQKELGSKPTDA